MPTWPRRRGQSRAGVYGLNSQLVKDPETGLLHERTWSRGMYSPPSKRIVYWLDRPPRWPRSRSTTIATLADYYRRAT